MLHCRHTFRNSLLLISPLVLGLAVVLASCGESKVAQCNKLSAEIGQTQTLYEKLGETSKGFSTITSTKPEEKKAEIEKIVNSIQVVVSDIRKVNQAIKAVALNDKKIQEFRDSYATQVEIVAAGFEDSSKGISSMLAIDTNTPDAVKQVDASEKEIEGNLQKAGKAGQESNKIVDEINTYCREK